MDLLEQARRIRNGDKGGWDQFVPAFNEIGRRSLRTFRLSPDDQNDILSQALAKLYAGGFADVRKLSLLCRRDKAVA